MDPRCQSGFFKTATHDYEIVDKTVARNSAAETVLRRVKCMEGDLLLKLADAARPLVVFTFKCRLCGCITQRHTP